MSAIRARLRDASTSAPRPFWTLGVLAVLVVVVTLGGEALGGAEFDRAISTMLVYLIAVVGLHTFIGNSGVFSFGHVGFIAVGAYTTAAFRIPEGTKAAVFPGLPSTTLSPDAATLAGGLGAAVAGLVVAVVVCRLDGLAAALATFAFLSIVFVVASNLKSVTGGQTGLFGVPLSTTPGAALPWALFAIAVAWLYGETRTCLRLRATRDDGVAARSLGIGIWSQRVGGFTVSAFLCGISGGLLAQYLGTFNPQGFYLDLTLLTIAMLVVGGSRSISGAVVGSIFLALVREWLRHLEDGFSVGPLAVSGHPGLQNLGMSIALLAVLLLIPTGLTRGKELGPFVAALLLPRTRSASPVVPADEAVTPSTGQEAGTQTSPEAVETAPAEGEGAAL